jgi:predicted nucleic acid-binding protein
MKQFFDTSILIAAFWRGHPDHEASIKLLVAADMHGTPCFTDTRVPFQTLIDFLVTGASIDDFLLVYPYIAREQVHD